VKSTDEEPEQRAGQRRQRGRRVNQDGLKKEKEQNGRLEQIGKKKEIGTVR